MILAGYVMKFGFLRKTVKFLFVTFFALAFFFMIGIWLISKTETDSNEFKLFTEGYFTGILQRPTEIGKLNSMQVYPIIEIDVGDIIAGENKSKPEISIDRVLFRTRFVDYFLSRQTVLNFELENLLIKKDILFNKEFYISKAEISDSQTDEAAILLNGSYGDSEFNMVIGSPVSKNTKYGNTYKIMQGGDFQANIGKISIDSNYERILKHTKGGYNFTDISASMENSKIFSGNAELILINTENTKQIAGNATTNNDGKPNNSEFAFVITFTPPYADESGKQINASQNILMNFVNLELSDLEQNSDTLLFAQEFTKIFFNDDEDSYPNEQELTADIFIKNVTYKDEISDISDIELKYEKETWKIRGKNDEDYAILKELSDISDFNPVIQKRFKISD